MNNIVEENKKHSNSSNYSSRNQYSANFVGANQNRIQTKQKVYELNTKNTSETKVKQKTTKEKIENLTNVLKIFIIMISATTVVGSVGIFDYFFVPTSSITVGRFELNVWDSGVSYFGSLENYEGQEDIYIVLRNDFTNRTAKVEEQMFEGVFEDLQTNMNYTFEIKHGDVVIVSKTVKTINKEYSQDGGPTNG